MVRTSDLNQQRKRSPIVKANRKAKRNEGTIHDLSPEDYEKLQKLQEEMFRVAAEQKAKAESVKKMMTVGRICG